MKNIIIDFAKPSNLERLIQLCGLHADYEKAAFDPKGKEQALRDALFGEEPPLYCLIAISKGEKVGYATYMKQFSTWDAANYIYMDCLFITEEARGLGIGQRLVERIQEEGKKAGCSMVQWQTPSFNTRAMKFYRRIGASSKAKERFFLGID